MFKHEILQIEKVLRNGACMWRARESCVKKVFTSFRFGGMPWRGESCFYLFLFR